jgi:hypothetical protein
MWDFATPSASMRTSSVAWLNRHRARRASKESPEGGVLPRSPESRCESLRGKLDTISEEQHRATVERLAPIKQPSCELHGWTAPGPGSLNREAVAWLCPGCREDRKHKAREEATPAVEVLELWKGSAYA